MERFFGMMIRDEIKLERIYIDENKLRIIIQTGDGGYSILYADGSSEYSDNDKNYIENFKDAYLILRRNFGNLKSVKIK